MKKERVAFIRTVEELMEAAHGYQRSMALFAALELGVFSALAEGPRDAARVARSLGADPGRLSIRMNAMVALGLLQKKGRVYRNGEVAARYLVDGPLSKASILLHHLDCLPDWAGLAGRIRVRGKRAASGKGYQENFIRGMEDNARERAAQVARRIPLRTGERVLDLGGGPGTYAVEWARRHPAARLVVFDLPETLEVTRRILAEKGVAGRIELLEGDFTRDPLGGPYDLVWISQILHAHAEADCVRLLRKVRKALAPGGRVAVQEFLLEQGGTSPPGPAFFSVHMAAVTDGGKAYTAGEISAMLRAAGFRKVAADRPDVRGVGIVTAR